MLYCRIAADRCPVCASTRISVPVRRLAQRVECDEAAGDFDGLIRLPLAEEMVHRTLEGGASNGCDALALREEPVLKLDLPDVEVVQQVALVEARCLEVCLWGAGCDEADETVDIGLHPLAPKARHDPQCS